MIKPTSAEYNSNEIIQMNTETEIHNEMIEIESTLATPRKKETRKRKRTKIHRNRVLASVASQPSGFRGRAMAAVVASDFIFFEGNFMQVGDVVSITDVEGRKYYAQIGSFLTDQYSQKRALITWLLPTRASPNPDLSFDPATYIIGPEDDTPHKLDYMQFVMHLPSDYYKDWNICFPLAEAEVNNSIS